MRLLREVVWRYAKDEAMLNLASEVVAFIADGRIGLALAAGGLTAGTVCGMHVLGRLSTIEQRLADAERFINKPPEHTWMRRC